MSLRDRIKTTVVLSDFIQKKIGINVINKGQRSWICCPFHNENTPSFALYNNKQFGYCFGCNWSGDIFAFVMEYYSIAFTEALRMLCEHTNIPFRENEKYVSNDFLYVILNQAYEFYQKQLAFNLKAQEYVKERGLTECNNIGYSPANSEVVDFLLQKGYRMDQIEKSGICNPQGYDRLSGRIVFAIYDRKKIIGFAGRSINNHIMPKYINFPETELFHKQLNLFNDQNADSQKPVILVEGYVDAIQIQIHTCYNGLSIMGTNISPEQLLKALYINRNIYIMFDNDVSGQNAILKNLPNILSVIQPGDNIYICSFQMTNINIKDADDAIRLIDSKYIDYCISKSVLLSEWIYNYIYKDGQSKLPEYQSKTNQLIDNIVNNISNVNIRLSYKKFLKDRRQNIRSNQVFRNNILDKEDCLMKMLRKFPCLWIQYFERLNRYIFRNKTYGKINELLNNNFIKNQKNYEKFEEETKEIFNAYLTNHEKTSDLSDTILNEKFASFYVGDIISSLS